MSSQHVTHEDHLLRITAVLELIQARSSDYTDNEPIHYALDLVLDMLPNDEQFKKALTS
ncbi:hypothetical protein N8Z33_00985 [Flavobacteriaceae bacterium]|nr:hypothetical protein [Flavobacteriaceae bacterium]MDC1285242.1 hypothetical protein [Flavobacteriaceae bacterium]